MSSDPLMSAIYRFSDAWASGDWKTIEDLTSESYSHVDISGTLFDRDGWLAYVRRREGQGTQITFDELSVRRFGDVAIVTGINDIDWVGDGPGDVHDQRIRFTQIWRSIDGRWKREAFQASALPSG